MSVKSEEADKRFKEWKEELLKRCDEHLDKHPEEYKPPKKVDAKKDFVMPNLIVKVYESDVVPGRWDVWKNGFLEKSFYGLTAQSEASKFGNYLLNDEQSEGPSTISDRIRENKDAAIGCCIFCGGKYVHREDCPDARKDGPDYPGRSGW